MDLSNLTLVTTAHNNEQMSHAMLESFDAHLGRCAEVVIVDDGSKTPFTAPALQSPMRVIRNEKATGFCQAADKAVRAANTEYALLVDADVLFLPGDFESGFLEFQSDPKWAWVNFIQQNFQKEPAGAYEKEIYPPWVFALGNQVLETWRSKNEKPLETKPGTRIADVKVAYSSSTLVKMSAYREIGGLDPWYWQCECDSDISIRFLRAGYRVGIDTGYTVLHEGYTSNTGGDPRTMDLYRARLYRYEKLFPESRLFLRPLLFMRHGAELAYFLMRNTPGQSRDQMLKLRLEMFRTVMQGYKRA